MKKGFTLIELLVIIAIVGIVCSVIFGLFIQIHAPNSGDHTGYVTAVEQEGLIWHTYRAFIKTDPQSSQEDQYCVTDPDVISQLQKDSESRTLITVGYSIGLITYPWQCKGESSIINSVK